MAKFNNGVRRKVLILLGSTSLLSPVSAYAQAQPAPPPAPVSADAQAADQADAGIADIVVTAERRSSSVQDTPIAITAFTGTALAEQGIVNVENLSEVTPSLQIYAEQINNEEYTIRGIGRSNEDLTTDSGVAVNINDAYLAQPSEANAALFDIERVEVLRGPQGTLYGKNAVGGVINIITRKPTDKLDGYAAAEIGGLGRRQFEAAVGAPVVDGLLSARIAGFSLHTDGAYRNLTTGERANGQDIQALRGSLRFTPSEKFEVNLVADYSDIKQDGVLKSVIVDTPGLPFILKDFFPGPYPTQEADIRSGRSNLNGSQGIRQWGGLLRADYYSDAGTISFLSSYRKERSYNSEDVDRTALQINNFFARQHSWATSQELRFVSDDDGPLSANGRLHWSGGLYWFHEEGQRNQSIYLTGRIPGSQPGDPDDPDNGLIGPGSPDAQDSTASFLQRLNTDSYAAFGQAKYDITDRLGITLGLRYTSETKAFSLDATSVANTPGGDPFALFLPDGPFSESTSATFRKLTPKVVVEYEPNADIHAYASYARGFKSGGFNGQAGSPADMTPFAPEVADNYELGIKTDLFDRRLRINAAAFFVKFKDLQVSGVNAQGLIITENAADAQIKGIEVEATVRPFSALTLRGGLSLLDAKYKDYMIETFDPTIQGGPPFVTLDLNGKRLTSTPEYSATAAADYVVDLSGGSNIKFSVDATFKGDTLSNELTLRSNAYAVVNARIGWTSSDGRWDIAGWVRNLTDKVYYRGGGALPDFNRTTSRIGLVSDPRTAGVTVKIAFGN
ncbi:TonB-dependent receptor [Sphingomonas sp.]|uniref:TonB-dependent receptor n=1 Tax=Sphingomonas sp. TaxID=28214 RepID=UPI003D6D5C17